MAMNTVPTNDPTDISSRLSVSSAPETQPARQTPTSSNGVPNDDESKQFPLG
jgi:hypothetical protein